MQFIIRAGGFRACSITDGACSPSEYMLLHPSSEGEEGRLAVVTFKKGRMMQPLCIDVYDNEDACEPDAVGRVELVSGSVIQPVGTTSTTIYIEDDDRKSIHYLGTLTQTCCTNANE